MRKEHVKDHDEVIVENKSIDNESRKHYLFY